MSMARFTLACFHTNFTTLIFMKMPQISQKKSQKTTQQGLCGLHQKSMCLLVQKNNSRGFLWKTTRPFGTQLLEGAEGACRVCSAKALYFRSRFTHAAEALYFRSRFTRAAEALYFRSRFTRAAEALYFHSRFTGAAKAFYFRSRVTHAAKALYFRSRFAHAAELIVFSGVWSEFLLFLPNNRIWMGLGGQDSKAERPCRDQVCIMCERQGIHPVSCVCVCL